MPHLANSDLNPTPTPNREADPNSDCEAHTDSDFKLPGGLSNGRDLLHRLRLQGEDSNSGTSKSSPWQHQPYKAGFSGKYTHAEWRLSSFSKAE